MSNNPRLEKAKLTALVAWAIGVNLAGPLGAALIAPVTATTNMGAGFGTKLPATVDGTGLAGGVPSLTAMHDSTLPDNSWVSDSGTLTGFVDFSLGGSYLVDGFSFWNQNDGGPGALGSTGLRGVKVTSSLDGVTYLPVPGAPDFFAQVPGLGPVLPETFSFLGVTASHLRFEILSNYGDAFQTGFGEVQFSGTPAAVPEPGTALAGLLALGLCGWRARRRT